MRYLDIGLAIMICTSATAGLLALSPSPQDVASSQIRETIMLRDALVSFVNSKGMPWFVQNSLGTICSDISRPANDSIGLTASVGTASCPTSPPRGATTAQLTFEVARQQVTLIDWPVARQ